jgi:hypothetical protein
MNSLFNIINDPFDESDNLSNRFRRSTNNPFFWFFYSLVLILILFVLVFVYTSSYVSECQRYVHHKCTIVDVHQGHFFKIKLENGIMNNIEIDFSSQPCYYSECTNKTYDCWETNFNSTYILKNPLYYDCLKVFRAFLSTIIGIILTIIILVIGACMNKYFIGWL